MSWMPPTGTFSVEKPATDKFMPIGGWETVVPPVSPWTVGKATFIPQAYQSDDNLKKSFGIELAKTANAFEAGCKVFGEDTSKALWASVNWINDPIAIASRDIYLKTVDLSSPPLDKDQLAAKVLALADEKILKNGILVPTIDAKDRIAALKLYSEIQGFTGKVEVDASTKTFTHNEMVIKLVKAEEKKPVVINSTPNVKSEIKNETNSPITLKLVGGASR